MADSFIYNSIPSNALGQCGYFSPGREFRPLSDQNFIDNISNVLISKHTQIIYFPGSFGCFHEGHLSVVRQAYEEASAISDNVVVVIAPAHSDYTVEKYGDTDFASNKFRYERIRQLAYALKKWNVVIDLNPMLNFEVDHNFTDLLKFFVERNVGSFDSLSHAPMIVSGKDRNFTALEKYSGKVRVGYFPETISMGTSTNFTPLQRPLKDLYLRVHTATEFDIFVRHMKAFYKTIKPVFIGEERAAVKALAQQKPCMTICKDYADIVPYIKMSRQYETPISDGHHDHGADLVSQFEPYSEFTVIDSDVFSGGTRRFIRSLGMPFFALIDLASEDHVELLDIDDFKLDAFSYPYVDLSSRCSLPAFTRNEYDVLNALKNELIQHSEEALYAD